MGGSMTTPKELAEEFRRLADQANVRRARHLDHGDESAHHIADGKAQAFAIAAQMVEERLGGLERKEE